MNWLLFALALNAMSAAVVCLLFIPAMISGADVLSAVGYMLQSAVIACVCGAVAWVGLLDMWRKRGRR